MDSQLLTLFLSVAFFVAIAIAFFFFSRQSTREKQRATSLLNNIDVGEEETDTEQEIKEIKSHEAKTFHISNFKWILCVLFPLLLLLLANFELFFSFYPTPVVDRVYPITLKAAYPFTYFGQQFNPDSPPLIERGKIATQQDVDLVKAYRYNRHYPPLERIIGHFGLFLLLCLAMVYWVSHLTGDHRENENKDLVFIFLLIFIVLGVAKFAELTSFFPLYYAPISMLAAMVAILMSNRLAPITTLFTMLFLMPVCRLEPGPALILFGGGMAAIIWLRRVKKRSHVLWAGVAAGMFHVLLYASLGLIEKQDFLSTAVQKNLFACFFSGIISCFLTLLLIPIFEKTFSYLSPFSLMELSDLDSILLRELSLKAPGTYHHSLSVANLAEIAANEIGANALLLRVGAYYHDIGKMFKPAYFIENVANLSENPHDKIPPFASSKILKSHVILGLEIGRKFGLPKQVLDLIPQHHGTTVMDFFYEKARNKPETASISEQYFSYPGPKPVTREAGILMLVDSIEAASRVLKDHSEETVRKMIEKIVNHKMEQGQLDRSPLTGEEVRKIIYGLTKSLATSTHKRIDYPTGSGGINGQFTAQSATRTEPIDKDILTAADSGEFKKDANGEVHRVQPQAASPAAAPVPAPVPAQVATPAAGPAPSSAAGHAPDTAGKTKKHSSKETRWTVSPSTPTRRPRLSAPTRRRSAPATWSSLPVRFPWTRPPASWSRATSKPRPTGYSPTSRRCWKRPGPRWRTRSRRPAFCGTWAISRPSMPSTTSTWANTSRPGAPSRSPGCPWTRPWRST